MDRLANAILWAGIMIMAGLAFSRPHTITVRMIDSTTCEAGE